VPLIFLLFNPFAASLANDIRVEFVSRIVFTAHTARLWTGLRTEEEEDGVSAGRGKDLLKR